MRPGLRGSLLFFVFSPGLVHAQVPDVRTAVINAQPARYEPAGCGIKTGHFKVGSGATYLSTAINNQANRDRLLGDGERVLLEAIRDNGQASNPAAWYYLGRVKLYQGDLIGADTAFARAEALAPACHDEIQGFRRATAAALQEPAGLLLQAEKNDSALAIYRLAVRINPSNAGTALAVGSLFDNGGQTDSALAYYRKAATGGSSPTDRSAGLARMRMASLYVRSNELDSATVYYQRLASDAAAAGDVDARNSATMSLAAALYNGKRYEAAIPLLRQYVAWRPDAQAPRQYLASAFRAVGQVDSADAIMRQPGVSVGMNGPDTVSAVYFVNRGAARFQANEHAKAAEDFEHALTVEPNNRLALRNLAATYYTLKNGPKLAEIAGRLVVLEPLSESARRLQNQGYIWTNERQKLERLSDELDAMPVAVENLKFTGSATGGTLSGMATGRAAKKAGAAVAPAPVTLVFEFLDGSGAVVTSNEVVVPALQAGVPSNVTATGTGQGIVDWRYKVK